MKIPIIIIAVIVAVTGSAYGYIKFTQQMNEPSAEEQKKAEEYVEKAFKETALEEQYPKFLDETVVQNLIHSMSHQKVASETKWGHEQITQAKIEQLLKVVIANQGHYSDRVLYIEILERWLKGDFSRAVEEHNKIWGLQDGTIGVAYRLLTPVEEKQYIEENFK